MKLAIMQPYFMPYLGYWQLINVVDSFVIYDNIEYTKNGYIRRNNYLLNGKSKTFSLSLKKDSDYLNICERVLSENFDKNKLLNQISASYKKAPYYDTVFELLKKIVFYSDDNLFNYIFNSIYIICDYLDIKTKLIISSTIEINHELKCQNKVLAFCDYFKCEKYISATGGKHLYSYADFSRNNCKLIYIKIGDIKYKQFDDNFVPNLSIIDVLMFNSKDDIKQMLNNCNFIDEFNDI